jgi:hypothetical protein
MRCVLLLLSTLVLCACGGDGISRTPPTGFVPTTPTPPSTPPAASPTPVDTISPTASGWLWVMVIDASGMCIDGAVIEVVSGQGKGFTGTPAATCDAWNPFGGYILYGLVPDDSLTMRASAPGFLDSEKLLYTSGAECCQASYIRLSKLYGPPSIPVGQPTLDLRHRSNPF